MLTRYGFVSIAATLALMSLGLAARPPPSAQTGDSASSEALDISDHESVARRFDAMAVQLEKQAAGHERLAQRYRSSPVAEERRVAKQLAFHCDRIAKNLKEAAADARYAAAMHRDILHRLMSR